MRPPPSLLRSALQTHPSSPSARRLTHRTSAARAAAASAIPSGSRRHPRSSSSAIASIGSSRRRLLLLLTTTTAVAAARASFLVCSSRSQLPSSYLTRTLRPPATMTSGMASRGPPAAPSVSSAAGLDPYDELAAPASYMATAAVPYLGDDRSPGARLSSWVPGGGGGRKRQRLGGRLGGAAAGGGGGEGGSEAVEQQQEEERPKRRPPTHFVAIQIDSPKIREEVAGVQAAIVAARRRLGAVMVPPSKLHVTLGGVLHLHGEGQLARARAVLAELVEREIRPFLANHNHDNNNGGGSEAAGSGGQQQQQQQQQQQGKEAGERELPPLRFPGLGSFGSRVLFLRPCEEHAGTAAWKEVSRMVWERLHAEGLTADAPPADKEAALAKIQLHGTIAKTSKMGRNSKAYAITREYWEAFERWELADEHQYQRFESVQLLRMQGNATDGYYQREAEYRLVASSTSVSDSSDAVAAPGAVGEAKAAAAGACDSDRIAAVGTETVVGEGKASVDVDVAFREVVLTTAVEKEGEQRESRRD